MRFTSSSAVAVAVGPAYRAARGRVPFGGRGEVKGSREFEAARTSGSAKVAPPVVSLGFDFRGGVFLFNLERSLASP